MPLSFIGRAAWVVLSCMATQPAWAELTAGGFKLNHADAEVGVTTAFRLHGNDRITQKAVYFKTNLEGNLGGGYFKAKGRVRYDARYDGSNPYSDRARDKYRFDADWRHLYWGHSVGGGEITVGWQQVVWGRADELRVLDQINPLNYRDGLTPLLEDSRIAVPMVRFSQPVGEWELEALWVTDFVRNQPPVDGSEFAAPLFAAPDPQYFLVNSKPDYDGAKGFSYGLSANGRVGAVDTSFVALYARQQDPVYAIKGVANDGRTRLERTFPRYTMAGAGLAIDVGHSIVIRSEIAWFDNWRVTRPTRAYGTDSTSMVKSLLGVDYLLRDWLISAQWQHQQLFGWQEGMLQDKREHLFTLSADGTHWQDRLKTRWAIAASPPFPGNALLQGRFTYKPGDRIKLGLEVDVFFGKSDKPFGQYDKRDQVRLSVGYLF